MKKIQDSLMVGVVHMLPFIVAAGLIIAFTGMFITQNIVNDFITNLNNFAWIIMGLLPAIFSMYLAYGLAGKKAIAPGFLGGYIASYPIIAGTASSGMLGGLVAGLVAGYVVNYLKNIMLPNFLESFRDTMLIPLFSILIVYFLMAYPIGYICGWLNSSLINWLVEMSTIPSMSLIIGALVSIMFAIDMGGPLSKIALTFVFAIWSDPSGIGFYVNAALFPGIMIPPLACGITSLIAKNKFTKEEFDNATATIVTGSVGITESTLPYAFREPKATIIPNVIGSGIGGALVMAFGISTAGVSGIIGIPMANKPVLFILIIVVGLVISIVLQLIFRKPIAPSKTV